MSDWDARAPCGTISMQIFERKDGDALVKDVWIDV